MSMTKNDNMSGGKWRNFELSSAHLLTCNPVVKRKSSKSHDTQHASVDDVATASSAKSSLKKTYIRKTGMHLK